MSGGFVAAQHQCSRHKLLNNPMIRSKQDKSACAGRHIRLSPRHIRALLEARVVQSTPSHYGSTLTHTPRKKLHTVLTAAAESPNPAPSTLRFLNGSERSLKDAIRMRSPDEIANRFPVLESPPIDSLAYMYNNPGGRLIESRMERASLKKGKSIP